MYKLTIFTPSYNRAHTLPRLYDSICRQSQLNDIEWLLIDDCSTDNTEQLAKNWLKEGKINLNYIRLSENGGKPRAINKACQLAQSPYLFIVDSDDYLVDGIIEFILSKLSDVANNDKYLGLGFLLIHPNGEYFAHPNFEEYADATDLEREKIGLNVDCKEVYKISILKKYPFKVWDGEIFTPESTVLYAMALDGYKIRWYNKPGVVAEYQQDGMTLGSWNLQKRNPMGYALLFNSNLLWQTGFKKRFKTSALFVSQCLLGRQPLYILKSNATLLTLASLPFGFAIYLRRLLQYRKSVIIPAYNGA